MGIVLSICGIIATLIVISLTLMRIDKALLHIAENYEIMVERDYVDRLNRHQEKSSPERPENRTMFSKPH